MAQFTISSSHRVGFLPIAGLSFALLLAPTASSGAAQGPFRPFLGAWSGVGSVATTGGQKERIRCRATYANENSETALTITLVCASDSFRFNVESLATASEGALHGQWQETTRGVQGELSGRIGGGDFEGSVSGAGFTAQMSIRTTGHKQLVSIRPSAGDIASVEVTMSRQR